MAAMHAARLVVEEKIANVALDLLRDSCHSPLICLRCAAADALSGLRQAPDAHHASECQRSAESLTQSTQCTASERARTMQTIVLLCLPSLRNT